VLSGLVLFAERRNLVSAPVPSHFKRSLPHTAVAGVLGLTQCRCPMIYTVSLPHDIHSVVAPWYTQCRCPMIYTSTAMVQVTYFSNDITSTLWGRGSCLNTRTLLGWGWFCNRIDLYFLLVIGFESNYTVSCYLQRVLIWLSGTPPPTVSGACTYLKRSWVATSWLRSARS